MSKNTNNIVITGGNFTQNNSADGPGIQKLCEYVAKDAFHNSQERAKEAESRSVNKIAHDWRKWLQSMSTLSFAVPASSTSASRDPLFKALVVDDAIKDIFIWLHDPFTHCPAMWVYDDDRSLTSLIGQAVADTLAKREELAATYFFPSKRQRGSSNPGNGTAYPSLVVPTIAYQLVRKIPGIEAIVAGTLMRDITILDLKVDEQIAKLVVEPLKEVSKLLKQLPPKANVIVVHGLEDCDNADFQTMFLDAVINGLSSIDPIPFSQRLLVLGRSTDRLQECFSNLSGQVLQRPVHAQRSWTREQDMDRRYEKMRKDEEAHKKRLDTLAQDADAVRWQKAYEIRSQARQTEEGFRQREVGLLRQEEELRRRQEEVLRQEVELNELHKREQWVMQQIEALKKREDKVNQREQQIDGLEGEGTLDIEKKEFGQFSIVVIGDSGVGKTSLIRNILGIDSKGAHDDAARSANIDSEDILRFNLQELGSLIRKTMRGDNTVYIWKIVEHFFRTRSERKLQERIHGIWLCIDLAPGFFFRPKSVIDNEKLFSLAKELNIPVFPVFTKYDLLVNQKRRGRGDPSESDSERNAENWFRDYIKRRNLVRPESAPFVKVSTSENYPRRLETLQELTTVTLEYLDKYYGLDADLETS